MLPVQPNRSLHSDAAASGSAGELGRSTYGECDLVLAEGPSSVTTEEVTSYLLTNRWVIGHFVEREIRVEGALGERGRLTVA
jgi:hypothetical protein